MVMHAMLELLRGELAGADELSAQAFELLQRADDPDAEPVRALQRFAVDLEAGDMEAAAAATAHPPDRRPLWRCLRAWALAESDDAERARQFLVHPDAIPRDGA